MGYWWATYLLGCFVERIANEVLGMGMSSDQLLLKLGGRLAEAAASLILVVAAVLAIRLVRGIASRQEQAHDKVHRGIATTE